MLIKFQDIVDKYGKPKGIIHIGAHLMEERIDYVSNGLLNTIWIEANPNVFKSIDYVNESSSQERAFNFAICDRDGETVKLNITNNGQSSSILELEKHKVHHPWVYVSDVAFVSTKRMDTLIMESGIRIDDYDFLNIDIQGAELLALKGFGEMLNSISKIYIEINTNELYKGCPLVGEIDEYLGEFGFHRAETSLTEFEWGDALYIKQ